jgi:hypothetical protein
MNDTTAVKTRTWTWADLVSTYRFWVLLIFYVVSTCVFVSFSWTYPLLKRHISSAEMIVIFEVRSYSGFVALYLAWLAVRWKPKRVLLIAGVLQLVGLLFVVLPITATSPAIRIVGAVSWGLGYSALMLAIPAFLAGSLGGTGGFVVAFGVLLTLSRLIQILVPFSRLEAQLDPSTVSMVLGVPLLLALLLVLPVNPALFHDPPPPRGRSFAPRRRNPVGVGFLCLIPFYSLYWLYRSHGEVASFAPSRALLSPGGAIGVSFIPLMTPIMLTTLIDELNGRAADFEIRRLRSAWVVFLWSMVLFPVGAGLVQSAMNQVTARSEALRAPSLE